jgi:hypothetical protein
MTPGNLVLVALNLLWLVLLGVVLLIPYWSRRRTRVLERMQEERHNHDQLD